MTIIIGLGNPGEKLKDTKHNVGFLVLNEFAKKNNFENFKLSKKFIAEISDGQIGDERIILAKPQTFMNNSGKSIQKIISNFKFQISNSIVVHDDIDLPVGKIKIVKERGSAGHKGVESIIKAIGNKGIIRIRIGIESENKNIKAEESVLKKFSAKEKEKIKFSILKSADAINSLIKNGLEKTMNEYNK